MTSALPAQARGVGIAGTTLAHGLLIALVLWTAHRGTEHHGVTYEVNLVAAPAPAPGSRVAEAAAKPVPRPAPKKPVAKPKPAAHKPVPKPVATRPSQVAIAPRLTPAVVPAPGEKPGTGNDVVTLHQDGLTFPFPDYLNNIVNKVYKRWNHSMFRPGLEAKIAFVISKDGSVDESSYVVEKSSGSQPFDEAARAAIESVVAHHEFGPLPDLFTGVSLPILFVFTQVRPGQQ